MVYPQVPVVPVEASLAETLLLLEGLVAFRFSIMAELVFTLRLDKPGYLCLLTLHTEAMVEGEEMHPSQQQR